MSSVLQPSRSAARAVHRTALRRLASTDARESIWLGASKLRPAPLTYSENLAMRQRHLSPSLKTHYAASEAGPLKLKSGQAQYLYDMEGRAYLDCGEPLPNFSRSARKRQLSAAHPLQ